jgi:galactonate dehydratase
MKVTQIKNFPIADEDGRVYYIVKVETDSGIYGLGEVGIRNWGGAIGKAVEHLSQVVIGEDPFSTEKMWQQMFRGGFFPADKVYSCAISAIDIGLWDIKAKALDMPLYKLLGGPVRDKVICYPHTQGDTMSELLENCKSHVDANEQISTRHQCDFCSFPIIPTLCLLEYVDSRSLYLLPGHQGVPIGAYREL